MSIKRIKIRCQAADTLPLDSLINFQGDLKKISKSNLDKLKTRIIDEGFIAPIFIWKNSGCYYILDGHQRVTAILSLRENGYDIPLLPVVYIDAENKQDAKQKLLSITSQYGEFQKSELESWLSEIDDNIKNDLRFLDKEIKFGIPELDNTVDNEIEYKEKFELIITLNNFSELESIFEELKSRGLKCKISTL